MEKEKTPKQQLIELRARLPLNYANTIVKALKKKHNKTVTAQHVRRTLSIPPKKFPNVIIQEAIKLADKQDQARKKVKKTINDW